MDEKFHPAKRDWTLIARGLDMERAEEIFDGPHLTRPDDRKDYGEDRNITVGFLDERMVVMVWTPRGGKVRVISLRKANEREQKLFGARLRRG